MNKIKKIDILYHERKAGTLASMRNNKVALEYEP